MTVCGKGEGKRLPELTNLSGLAILLVLLIHSFASALSNIYMESEYIYTPFLFRAISYFIAPAVPIFIFISGYKYALRDSDTTYLAFLKKRLPRVLMSFLIINTLFWLINSIVYYDLTDVVLLAKTYISSWVGNTVAYPLWYIPMYCLVIIICPLLRKIIPNNLIRFLLWLCVAMIQKLLAIYIPIVAEKPFVFLTYPVFFEMGIWAHDKNWKQVRHPKLICLPYLFIGIVLAAIIKDQSIYNLVEYTYFCLLGVPVIYLLVANTKPTPLLVYLGEYSYPIFLFHEPVIGQCTGIMLLYFGIGKAGTYCMLWVIITLFATLLFIRIIKNTAFYRVTCNFTIDNQKVSKWGGKTECKM